MAGIDLLNIEVRCRQRWWLGPYIEVLAFLCAVFDVDPDWEKLDRMLRRGLVVETNISGRWKRLA